MTPVRGVYAGAPAGVTAFEGWLGKPVGRAHVFVPKATWTDITAAAVLGGWKARRGRVAFTLPMLPKDPAATLQAGAAGRYDATFRQFARNALAAGLANSPVRVGHEPNGKWSRWYAGADPAAYRTYFRRIVAALRHESYTGPVIFSPAAPYQGWDSTSCWPGADVVDRLYVDCYDVWWAHPEKTPEQRWAHLLTAYRQGGIEFWRLFAERYGLPFGFAEWGLVKRDSMVQESGGGDDDPFYVQAMHDYTAAHCAEEWYFNADPADGAHRLDTGQFPEAAALYRQLWAA